MKFVGAFCATMLGACVAAGICSYIEYRGKTENPSIKDFAKKVSDKVVKRCKCDECIKCNECEDNDICTD